MRYHNIERDQDFDTDWIGGKTTDDEKLQIVKLLKAYGYITYRPVKRKWNTAYLCRLTDEGIKFCKEGGFKALEEQRLNEQKNKRREHIKTIVEIIAVLISILVTMIGLFAK